MFAGSCIGVVLLVMSLELLRRLAAEYDKYIAGRPSRFFASWFRSSNSPEAVRSAWASLTSSVPKDSSAALVAQPNSSSAAAPLDPEHQQHQPQQDPKNPQHCESQAHLRRVRPTLLQHAIRSLLHMLQFGVAYFVMLLAMYYNGYFIICILIGSFLGYFVFSWNSMEAKYV